MSVKNERAGFSLIEVMVGLGLTAGVVLLVSSFQDMTFRAVLKANTQDKMSTMRNLVYQNLKSDPSQPLGERCRVNLIANFANPAAIIDVPASVQNTAGVVVLSDGLVSGDLTYRARLDVQSAALDVTRDDGQKYRSYAARLRVGASLTNATGNAGPSTLHSFDVPVTLLYTLPGGVYKGCSVTLGTESTTLPFASVQVGNSCTLSGGSLFAVGGKNYCRFSSTGMGGENSCPPGFTVVGGIPNGGFVVCDNPQTTIPEPAPVQCEAGWVGSPGNGSPNWVNPPYTAECSYFAGASTNLSGGAAFVACPSNDQGSMNFKSVSCYLKPAFSVDWEGNVTCSDTYGCCNSGLHVANCCSETCTHSKVDPSDPPNMICDAWSCTDNQIYTCSQTCSVNLSGICPASADWMAHPPGNAYCVKPLVKSCPSGFVPVSFFNYAGLLQGPAYASAVVAPNVNGIPSRCRKTYVPQAVVTCPAGWQTLSASVESAVCF